jgi:hypothetical protein
MVDFVTDAALVKARDALHDEAAKHDSKLYEDWLRLHNGLLDVAKSCGTVTDFGEADWYHGGDWFTSLSDGFALQTAKPLKKLSLEKFQHVLREHSPFASLSIGGEICGPVDGLEFFVHPQVALVSWRGKSRESCRAHLSALGFRAT